MTIYVDEIRDYTLIAKARRLRHTHWSHLTADTEEELHEFAKRLGLRRSWFQKKSDRDYRWHYDIVPSKRAAAVRMGAVEIDRHGVVALMDARRAAAGLESGDAVFQRVLDKAAAAGEVSEVGPRCGNNPNVKLSEGDRTAVDEFMAYLRERRAGEAS
ncbi:DUF4031 domain-containing protein [Streptomyces sparsogenes]|uniref:DUF4031 domain-containing protein n=1 Tax=Streptomyces sparsogenes DSM 40356 TaxID=1331668 RepID=A0A1R1S7Z4_9ACTN|nr:DUF4031 domain-containing protein [Streptomyces sparsogenes]OMI34445.1 hypothetical protein SPAR_36716 [Streptomyces sparsogenes DSM 40356]